MDSEPSNIPLQLLFLLFLTLVNAFFAAAEMALVSVNKNKIQNLSQDGNKSATLIIRLLYDQTSLLSTIQVAITFAGYFQSASAATGISQVLGSYLTTLGVPSAQTVSLVGITLLLSYTTLVFGELVPKRIALQNSEKIALFVVTPVYYVSKIMAPFVKFLSISTNLILRIFRVDTNNLEEAITEEEIKSLLETGSQTGVFNDIEKDMINSIFSFDDISARDIMVSRKDTYKIDIDNPLEDYLDDMIATYYTRIPVYKDDIDNIIGILNIKELFAKAREIGFENVVIKDILQEPYFVPEMKSIDTLFIEMQKTRNHIAILVDEYGGFSGIVTIEDLVEEVMGDINDEYDDEEKDIVQLPDGKYMLKGTTEIRDINKLLDIELEYDNFDTIAGMIMDSLGHIPEEDDECSVDIEHLTFKVNKISDNRIEQVIMIVNEEPEEEHKETFE